MKHSLGFLFNVHCCVILLSVSRLIFLSLTYMSVIIDTFICTWLKMIISVNMWLFIYPARYFNKLLSGDYQ